VHNTDAGISIGAHCTARMFEILKEAGIILFVEIRENVVQFRQKEHPQHHAKLSTTDDQIRQLCVNLQIFTDGSKTEEGVACSTSVFTEANAMYDAGKEKLIDWEKHLIPADSLSTISTIRDTLTSKEMKKLTSNPKPQIHFTTAVDS
jgi:hypothetical protein